MPGQEPTQAERRQAAEDELDALIARIHGLAGATPDAAPDAAPRPPAPPASAPPQTPAAPSSAARPSAAAHAPADRAAPSPAAPAPTTARPSPPAAATAVPATGPANAAAPAGRAARDEPWTPPEPQSLGEARLSESTVEEIALRFLLARGDAEGRRVAEQLKIPFRLVEPILTRMKSEQILAYRNGTATGDYVYVLTEAGRDRARRATADCTYYGAAPVPLGTYIASVQAQSIAGQRVSATELKAAFSDLLINPRMLDRLGPAVNSGRGMFLYGYPGNGKTSIAERVTGAFGKYLWIPRALQVEGEIMRLYDPMNHELDMPEESGGLLDQAAFDKRWVRIRRPTLVAGGELTMDMLEVRRNRESNISEAPLQLKSNCGTLVIDDFGRQKMSVDQLLNRWIVPLEKRYDYLNMASGKKIQVPFDQLVIFSTNLEPKDLVDDAFLRRIPYKIEVENPPEADFRKLFEIMCRVMKVPYAPEPIDYLIETHYKPVNRPYRNCQPRDLLLQVRNYCLYHQREIELRNEYFDFAVENYFSVM